MQYKSFDKLRHTVILLRGLPLRTPPTAKPTITVDFNLYILVVNLINQKFLLTNKKKSDIVNNNSIAEEGVAMTIFEELTKLSDKNYKEFHKKLIPTISSELILGIRTPVLRKFAKEFSKTSMAEEFLRNPHHKLTLVTASFGEQFSYRPHQNSMLRSQAIPQPRQRSVLRGSLRPLPV